MLQRIEKPSHFEEYLIIILYKICDILGFIDFTFDWKEHQFGALTKYRHFKRLLVLFLGLTIGFVPVLVSSTPLETLYVILSNVLYPINLWHRYSNQHAQEVDLWNQFYGCLRRTKQLTRKVIKFPWTLYTALCCKVIEILAVFVVAIFMFQGFVLALLMGSYVVLSHSIVATYVQAHTVTIQLYCLLRMYVNMNDYLSELLCDLEVYQQLLYEMNSSYLTFFDKFVSKIQDVSTAYQEMSKLLTAFNSLQAGEVKRIFLVIGTSAMMVFDPSPVISFTYAGVRVVGVLHLVYLWSIVLAPIWYQKIQCELTRCHVLAGMYRLRRDFEWDKQIDTMLLGIAIAKIDLLTHCKSTRTAFYWLMATLSCISYFYLSLYRNVNEGHNKQWKDFSTYFPEFIENAS